MGEGERIRQVNNYGLMQETTKSKRNAGYNKRWSADKILSLFAVKEGIIDSYCPFVVPMTSLFSFVQRHEGH